MLVKYFYLVTCTIYLQPKMFSSLHAIVGHTPIGPCVGLWLPNINKSAAHKVVDKNEHVDTISVYSNIDYEVKIKVN